MNKKQVKYKIEEIAQSHSSTWWIMPDFKKAVYRDCKESAQAMADWMQIQLGWYKTSDSYPLCDYWQDTYFVAICNDYTKRIFVGFCDEDANGAKIEHYYWDKPDSEKPVDFDEVIAWIELPLFSKT